MGFADAYLLKAGLREPLILSDPNPGLQIIVTIPVHNESGLERCLDSLFLNGDHLQASTTPVSCEVLILINASAEAPDGVLAQNLLTLGAAADWIAAHPHPSIDFHVLLDHSFGKKEAGVGLARKILMDEAVRRFSAVANPEGNPKGIIASLDADVVVDSNYLEALVSHFGGELSGSEGCSIYFEHPLGPGEVGSFEDAPSEKFSTEVYDAITQYELHLRYYLNSVRSTGYPYAYHTVGSSFAVRADIYCKEGGMNRRQGGEDFYFIQKVAQRGHWSECNSTRVLASPRPSDRVPFGTGPVVDRLVKQMTRGDDRTGSDQTIGDLLEGDLAGPSRLKTYHTEPFRMLSELFSGIDALYNEESAKGLIQVLDGVLVEFLDTQDFQTALEEIRGNSASLEAFIKRFWRWFNMFRIMKFLHFARGKGFPDVDVEIAAMELVSSMKGLFPDLPLVSRGTRELLEFFRKLDRR